METVTGIHWRRRYWVPNDIPPGQIDWSLYAPSPGFRVLPQRWVVERAFAWLSHNRRLSKEYERLCATAETRINVAMIRPWYAALLASEQGFQTVSDTFTRAS